MKRGEKKEAPAARDLPLAQALLRPKQSTKTAPCCSGCATGGDVRGWIGVVAQRDKLGYSEPEALDIAWYKLTEANPFPSTLGRICPHPCETGCSRMDKDGPVAINAMERFLGDWAIERELPLLQLEKNVKPESIGVIGSGPAGLSFAYQMARRNYRVTVYEKEGRAGGMLSFGIPEYRLPREVIDAEVQRIVDIGVELKLNVAIGRDISIRQLRENHDALFLGIGAGQGLKLGIPGESGNHVWSGTDYLGCIKRHVDVDLGSNVVVVGGGNTAVDAARSARRSGARVTILYRRTRNEMPAIEGEIDDAEAEGVYFEYLAVPVEIVREGDEVKAVIVQRMELGEPDDSGRRRPVPVPASEYELPASAVITAVSQQPIWNDLDEIDPGTVWVQTGDSGRIDDYLWAGGDALGLGIAGMAIAQGRQAAEALHAQLRKQAPPVKSERAPLPEQAVKADFHAGKQRSGSIETPVEERLADPDREVYTTMNHSDFIAEVSRCFSCGLCYGCENCYMYCNAGGFTRLEEAEPGAYFAMSRDYCVGCGKCIELCPSGYLTSE